MREALRESSLNRFIVRFTIGVSCIFIGATIYTASTAPLSPAVAPMLIVAAIMLVLSAVLLIALIHEAIPWDRAPPVGAIAPPLPDTFEATNPLHR